MTSLARPAHLVGRRHGRKWHGQQGNIGSGPCSSASASRSRASSARTPFRACPWPSVPAAAAWRCCSNRAAPYLSGINPVDEERLIRGLAERMFDRSPSARRRACGCIVKPDEETLLSPTGDLQIKIRRHRPAAAVAEALAMSVALAYDERRIALAFDRIDAGRRDAAGAASAVPAGRARCWSRSARRLRSAQRLAERIDLDDKPDVLWDHPELERFWARLVDEYDLTQRGPRDLAQARGHPRHGRHPHRPHGDAHQPPARALHHRADRDRDRPEPLRPLLEVEGLK